VDGQELHTVGEREWDMVPKYVTYCY
jgi:hypothetical protein